MAMTLKEWFWKKYDTVVYKLGLAWRMQPDKRKETILYLANYVVAAAFLSIIVIYVLHFSNPWIRYTLLIPVLTIFLVYFEYYYKWLRIGYKDQ